MNAADNPFRVSRIHALPFLWPEGESWQSLEARWQEHGRQGAITAPHGHGKSALLAAWMERLREQGWTCRRLTLTTEDPHPPKEFPETNWQPRDIAVLDGAEQLAWWGWRQWMSATKGAAGRIITNHRPGRLPTILQPQCRPQDLERMLQQLLGDGVPLPASPADLLQRHQGNIRDIFRELYEQFAARA
jgi:hypothetical protein